MLHSHPRDHATRTGGATVGARLTLGLLIVAEVAAIGVLVRLGRTTPFDLALDPRAWARADPVDALAAVARRVALVTAGWLLLVTLVAVVASALGRTRRGLRGSRFASVAPGAIRRIVERAVVSGLVVGAATLPSGAFAATRPDPPVVTIVRDGRAGDLASLPAGASPSAPSAGGAFEGDSSPGAPSPAPATAAAVVVSAPAPAPPAPPEPAPPLPGVERSVVVAPGEHLWALAAREVARVRGVAPGTLPDDDVVPYWSAMCDANRDRLLSGDVNLVFAGETIVLPPFV